MCIRSIEKFDLFSEHFWVIIACDFALSLINGGFLCTFITFDLFKLNHLISIALLSPLLWSILKVALIYLWRYHQIHVLCLFHLWSIVLIMLYTLQIETVSVFFEKLQKIRPLRWPFRLIDFFFCWWTETKLSRMYLRL